MTELESNNELDIPVKLGNVYYILCDLFNT